MDAKDFFKGLRGLLQQFSAQGKNVPLSDGTTITCDPDLAVEATVLVAGAPAADGEYTLEDGRTVVCAGGKITEIKEAAPAPPANAGGQELSEEEFNKLLDKIMGFSTQVDELKTQVEGFKANAEEAKAVKAELEALKTEVAQAKTERATVTETLQKINELVVKFGKEDKSNPPRNLFPPIADPKDRLTEIAAQINLMKADKN